MRLICEYRPQKYLCGLISANYKKKKKQKYFPMQKFAHLMY